jgi:carbamoyl-phosphate synthase large subunit
VALNKEKFEKLGTKVIVSDPGPIVIASNKYDMYEKLKNVKGINLPEYYYPRNLDEFVKFAHKLGYPKRAVCFKPHRSKGSRGFRILDESISRRDMLLNYKPESRYMSLKEFMEIFEKEKDFPKFILMEVIKGPEYDAMTLCFKGESLLTTVKSREQSRWGIITSGELIDKPEIVKAVEKIISVIPLSYNISLQFIDNKLIEINPRTSSYIYQDDLNEPYLAVKLCLGEISKEEVRSYQSKVRYGRRMLRYMDQLFWDKGSNKFED